MIPRLTGGIGLFYTYTAIFRPIPLPQNPANIGGTAILYIFIYIIINISI